MSRVAGWSEGFELQDNKFWTTLGAGAISTDQKRSGNASWKINGDIKSVSPTLSEFCIRFGLRAHNPNQSAILLEYRSASGTILGSLRWNNASKIFQVYRGTTKICDGASPIVGGTWYLIELHVKINNSGIVQLKIDGALDIDNSSVDTEPGTGSSVGFFEFTRIYQDTWIDDVALSDGDWIGDGHIVYLPANADGDATGAEWTASAGDRYTCVDEVPSTDDTDYIYDSTVNNHSLFNVASLPEAASEIKAVWVEARARETVANAEKISLPLKTLSTIYNDASPEFTMTTNYERCSGTIHTVNPNTSAAWTSAQIAALQAGVKTRS